MSPTPSNFNRKLALGIDIGGTAIKSVLLDDSGNTLQEGHSKSQAQQGPEQLREQILEIISSYLKQGFKVDYVGIGCAGSVDGHHGVVRYSPNFASGKNLTLKAWVQNGLNIPCVVENDANCAAVAEWKLGRGKGFHNIVLITLGTGVGGGLILNDRLYRGSTGTGGEIGHFSIQMQGIPGMYGLPGTFETYCSATAIQRESGGMPAKEVFERAGKFKAFKALLPDDPKPYEENPALTKEQRVVAEFLHNFCAATAGLANIFDPDIILLGGAMSEGVMEHIDEVRQRINSQIFQAIAAHMKIEKAHFGNQAGSIGAALLAFAECAPN